MIRYCACVLLVLLIPLGAAAGMQSVVYSDNTTPSSPVTDTLSPLADFITVDCQDPDGCDLTLSEAVDIAVDGSIIKIINTGANDIRFADVAGVQVVPGATATLSQDGVSEFVYADGKYCMSELQND